MSCPSCHYDLGLTQKIPVARGTWCPVCGALVPKGETICPKCGSPVGEEEHTPVAAKKSVRDLNLPTIEQEEDDKPEEEEDDASATQAIPRIESAIPSKTGTDAATVRSDRMPRTRMILFASVAALVLAVGTALIITHPWNPNLYQTHATEDADTSQAGATDAIDLLTGQDTTATSTETTSDSSSDSTSTSDTSTDSVYQAILDDYEKLGEYADDVDENFALFDEVAVDGTLSQRQEGAQNAETTATELSNLITDISNLSDGDGLYADDIANLKTLGNWLRNRSDAIRKAWDLSTTAAEEGETDEDTVYVPLKKIGYTVGGEDDYKTLFDENYESWKPEQKSE